LVFWRDGNGGHGCLLSIRRSYVINSIDTIYGCQETQLPGKIEFTEGQGLGQKQLDADGPASLSMERSVLQRKVDGLPFLGLHNIELSCAAESPARSEPQQPTLTRIRDAPKATTPTIC
jgi:hypothetical protein